MLFAEGSDWFWWYGSDQNSGNDDYFDSAYRALLGQMYDEHGSPRPGWLEVPIIPATPVLPAASPDDLISVSVDGVVDLSAGCVRSTSAGDCTPVPVAGGEVSVPLDTFGPLDFGDRLLLAVEGASGLFPASGPAQVHVPDVSNVEIVAAFTDPVADDYGPGSYVYPVDDVFAAGSFDLEGFTVGLTETDVVAPIRNPWGSPNGLAIQTFDVYAD